jgi:cap2 methyltransferase
MCHTLFLIGGHFVLKMFTLFESESVCALYLLRTLFKDLDVFKPATSKEGNSEVYVICRYMQPPTLKNKI